MRVGILDIVGMPATGAADMAYRVGLTKQFASITPQAISVWCRRLGHETYYAIYYGVGDPHRKLPPDLDVVFVSCYTQVSHLAYAVAKLFRQAGTRTVIGGPHARAFPVDCLRFFDVVVGECDADLVADLVEGDVDPGARVSSARPFEDVPTVEERMPEIRASALYWGRRSSPVSAVPMLASLGCPYSCDFCIDWDSPYRTLPTDRLAADLRYLAATLPRTMVMFHDPNFAVRFDEVFEVLEQQDGGHRQPYIIESSLTVLRGSRLQRLADTNCAMVAPGVESWTDYSNKAAVGRTGGVDKVDRVADHFAQLDEQVPYLQANFMFGLDSDEGDEPVELTKRFMDRTPFTWPTINIPVPFGGTPLHDTLTAEGRILTAMPFSFYYAPYLVTTIKNYDPVTYYEKLTELYAHAASPEMLRRRMTSTNRRSVRWINRARTAAFRADVRSFRDILELLRTDPSFRAFHEGTSTTLPSHYRDLAGRVLGRFAELLSPAERTPDLSPLP